MAINYSASMLGGTFGGGLGAIGAGSTGSAGLATPVLSGYPAGAYNPAYGGIPGVPNPGATQGSALSDNLNNMGGITQLTNLINSLNQQAAGQQQQMYQNEATWQANLDQQMAQWANQLNQGIAANNNANNLALAGQLNSLNQSIAQQNNAASLSAAHNADLLNQQMQRQWMEQNVPGLAGLQSQASANTAAQLAGQLPPDVVNQIAQQAAERGAATGMGVDSPSTNAALLQAMGLNSMQLQQQGQQNYSNLLGSVPNVPLANVPISTAPSASIPFSQTPFISPPSVSAPYATANQFDPSSMLLNPTALQEWQYLANELSAAPNPTAAAQNNLASLYAGLNAGRAGTGSNVLNSMFPPVQPINTSTNWGGGGSYDNRSVYGDYPGASTGSSNAGASGGSYYDSNSGYMYDPSADAYWDPNTGAYVDYSGGGSSSDTSNYDPYASQGYYDYNPSDYTDYANYG